MFGSQFYSGKKLFQHKENQLGENNENVSAVANSFDKAQLYTGLLFDHLDSNYYESSISFEDSYTFLTCSDDLRKPILKGSSMSSVCASSQIQGQDRGQEQRRPGPAHASLSSMTSASTTAAPSLLLSSEKYSRDGEVLVESNNSSSTSSSFSITSLSSFFPPEDNCSQDAVLVEAIKQKTRDIALVFNSLVTVAASKDKMMSTRKFIKNKAKFEDQSRLSENASDFSNDFVYMVRFKLGVRYYTTTLEDVSFGDFVICDGDRGDDLGVVLDKTHRAEWKPHLYTAGFRGKSFNIKTSQVMQIKSLASPAQILSIPRKLDEEMEVLKVIASKVQKTKLNMKIVDCEYQFDRHKLTIFYHSNTRVDFRDFVKELFSQFKTRIWMQQCEEDVRRIGSNAADQIAAAAGFLKNDGK